MCCPCFGFSCRFKSIENKLCASQLYEIAEMKNEHLWPRRIRMRLVSLAEGHNMDASQTDEEPIGALSTSSLNDDLLLELC